MLRVDVLKIMYATFNSCNSCYMIGSEPLVDLHLVNEVTVASFTRKRKKKQEKWKEESFIYPKVVIIFLMYTLLHDRMSKIL